MQTCVGMTEGGTIMTDTPGAANDLDRLPSESELARLQFVHGPLLPARNQPGQRAGPRQDRPERSGQHRGRRHGAGDDSRRRRARRPLPRLRGQDHAQDDCDTCSHARRVPSRTRPATRASSTISWTSKRVAAFGNASFPPSTRRSCSRAP